MIHNNAPLAFEVTSRTKTNIKTAIQFSTQDIDTARLIFSLTKDGVPLPLSAVTGKLVMFMADGSRFIRSVDITDKVEGVAQYVLSAEEIRHSGDVQAELYLYYANKQALSIHKFSFTIDKALIDTDIVPLAEYYVDDFEALRQQINDLYGEVVETVEELRKKFEDLENIETKEGAQAKADAAEKNAKSYTDTHTKRTDNPHSVTKDQIGLSNVENVRQADYYAFRQHDNNGERHTSKVEKDKWNGSQLFKLTQDTGAAKYMTDTDFNTVTDTGFYYMSGATTTLNAPVNNNGYLLVHNYSTYAYQEYTSYSSNDSTSSGRRKFMRNKVASSDSWTSWRELESVEGAQSKADKALTDAKAYADTKVGQLTGVWTVIPLINGAITDAASPLRFRTKNGGDEIQLNGGFKSTFNTIIASGLPKIKNPIEFLVATVGTYGYLRMDYRVNGDLYLAGGTVNSETGISKISVNITIPLA
ncbi:BppU family phage baseplate upper protein [Bacillus velezensis]|uniref:BppU family phage baseplate upper protein n=1 Tax=Bacillus velezensis TaxID=492670 RepID=UPI00039F8C0D|nr:BppU family phage baseplate upper protein [Bacillus velezensis]URD65268.1 BppU family phage baseplate upper protein [Bacillus velezensis]WED86983.1 BppU family phage baseplate upper protein [Bacillus velezensis]WED89326.1 BppU family phage baseplate upper protein [Bacillus velezensis]WFB52496.1 BppU family phage baseplate upper protein [Bacillus velezensis]WFB54839.1 BppU family phage baseplate upper protein [Bacillus velezensis]